MSTAAIANGSAACLPDKPNGAKLRMMTISDIDGRTLASRRARQLVDAIAQDLGGDLTMSQQQMATHAAILGAMIEDQAAKWLTGEKIDQSNYALLINAQRRVLATLSE
jgi:hypothetical protein